MTPAEASTLAWECVVPILRYVGYIAALLVGLALMKLISS